MIIDKRFAYPQQKINRRDPRRRTSKDCQSMSFSRFLGLFHSSYWQNSPKGVLSWRLPCFTVLLSHGLWTPNCFGERGRQSSTVCSFGLRYLKCFWQYSVTVPLSFVYCKRTPNEGLNQIIVLAEHGKQSNSGRIWDICDIIWAALSDLSTLFVTVPPSFPNLAHTM